MDINGQRRPSFSLHSIAGAAKITGLSERTIRRQIANGRLRARRAGSRILIHEADLERWFVGLAQVSGARGDRRC